MGEGKASENQSVELESTMPLDWEAEIWCCIIEWQHLLTFQTPEGLETELSSVADAPWFRIAGNTFSPPHRLVTFEIASQLCTQVLKKLREEERSQVSMAFSPLVQSSEHEGLPVCESCLFSYDSKSSSDIAASFAQLDLARLEALAAGCHVAEQEQIFPRFPSDLIDYLKAWNELFTQAAERKWGVLVRAI